MNFHYLNIDDLLAFHENQLILFGGASRVRDMGQLQAAIFRSQSGYYNDLIAEAAALWESLSQNHPFVDGNKRTAFVATAAFVYINGVKITADQDDAWEFIINLYESGTMIFDTLDAWLRTNTAPL